MLANNCQCKLVNLVVMSAILNIMSANIFLSQIDFIKVLMGEIALISHSSLPPPPQVMGRGGGLSHFSKDLYRGTQVKLGFWLGIGTLGGVDFFRWELKTPCTKNSEYKSQAKRKTNKQKKKILIVNSTISHFWSPTLTNLQQSVFVSLFSIVYTPPYPQIFFLWGAKFFFVSFRKQK